MNKYMVWMIILTLLLLNLFSFTITNAPAVSAESEDKAKWTFMVYLDADNNLESAGVEDVNEMETVGSTDDVNILVQFDRIEEYDVTNGDWTDTKRFRIEKDEDTQAISSPVLEDLGEINMGDPDNLIDFVLWGASNYPAEHYAVILWNHGGAFWGVCFDDTGDGENADALNMTDLRYAFLEIQKGLGGEKIDLVGFDACLMAEVAVLYQLRETTDFAVASGFVEPGDGWPYEKFLPSLIENPDMSTLELGKYIANTYVDSYTDQQEDPDDSTAITMSVFEMAKLPVTIERLTEFAMVLSTAAQTHNLQIWAARDRTESYDMVNAGPFDFTGYAMYDVIDFTEKIQTAIPLDTTVKDAATALREAAYDLIAYARADSFHPNAHGLTIYFPNTESSAIQVPGRNEYDPRFDEVDFAKNKYWDDFLFHYYAREDAMDTPPTVLIISPSNHEHLLANDGTVLIEGTAFDAQDKPTIDLRIDGNDWQEVQEGKQSPTGSTSWSYQWDIAQLSGHHTIEVKVTDNDGNEQIETHIVNIENTVKTEKSTDYSILIILIVILVVLVLLSVVVSRMRKLKRK
ncbi:MAG: hypothetical protein JSV49_03455 [Thermoplasmata archaeon]|nr:MAG: hypothetical protein JSV49_03455 [Thermoplasmata archaeon]